MKIQASRAAYAVPEEPGDSEAAEEADYAEIRPSILEKRSSGSELKVDLSVGSGYGLNYTENAIGIANRGDPEEEDDLISCSDAEPLGVQSVAPLTATLRIFTSQSTNGPDERIVTETATECHIRLNGTDSLVVLGYFDLWVQKGIVMVDGAIMQASPRLYRIFAPSTHSLPVIKSLSSPFWPTDQSTDLVIISCTPGLRLLRRISPLFGRIWGHNQCGDISEDCSSSDTSKRSFIVLRSSQDDKYKRPLISLDYTSETIALVQSLLDKEERPLSVMICGPKGSGKSTTARRLLNGALSRQSRRVADTGAKVNGVILLDLDPGQPEFSPPGTLSLIHLKNYNLGPSYTHPGLEGTAGSSVLRAHHLGTVSSSTDPCHYLECAFDLIDHYRAQLSSLPLVVNCSGWIQGTGLELLLELIQHRFITDLIYTSSSGPKEVISTLKATADSQKIALRLLSSQAPGLSNTSSASLRIMQSLSYFHLDEPEDGNLQWNPDPLSCRSPFTVHYAGPQQGILAVMIPGERLDPELYVSVLEGCIIGLVIVESDLALSVDAHEQDARSADSFSPRLGPMQSASHPPVAFQNQDEIPSPHTEDYTPTYLTHPCIKRTSTSLPYIASHGCSMRPLNPEFSYCIGQAIVRVIDPTKKTLHLVTPIPSHRLDELLCRQKQKLVLVRGKLDGAPTWAYQEEMHLMKSRIWSSLGAGGDKEKEVKGLERQMMKDWAKDVPWAEAKDKLQQLRRRSRTSWRPWRVRRDIRRVGDDSD